MTEKTCGTCGHCTMIHDRYAVASGVCNIDCRIDSSGHNCLRSVCSTTKPCGDYIERTDGLEQVALDMYRLMTCMAHYECHNSDRRTHEHYIPLRSVRRNHASERQHRGDAPRKQ